MLIKDRQPLDHGRNTAMVKIVLIIYDKLSTLFDAIKIVVRNQVDKKDNEVLQ